MRVIGGELKRRPILYPTKKGLRPTRGMVREAIFDILGERIKNAKVCDLFCGAGSLGIEALSRGASSVTFVEKDPKTFSFLKRNTSPFKDRVKLRRMDVDRFLKRAEEKFDIIFLDPPYNKGLILKTLKRLKEKGFLADDTLIVVEHSTTEPVPILKAIKKERERIYGDTVITLLSKG